MINSLPTGSKEQPNKHSNLIFPLDQYLDKNAFEIPLVYVHEEKQFLKVVESMHYFNNLGKSE